ncbi:MAG: hypothetical protein ACRENZ_05720 [Thermodesulfobacteriota bacterium]
MKLYFPKSLVGIVGVTPNFVGRLEEAEVKFPMREENELFYTERDIRKLFLAKDLQEMRVNLPGIEVILEIIYRMETLKCETNDLLFKILKHTDKNIDQLSF